MKMGNDCKDCVIQDCTGAKKISKLVKLEKPETDVMQFRILYILIIIVIVAFFVVVTSNKQQKIKQAAADLGKLARTERVPLLLTL